MDLNELLYAHQLEAMKANASSDDDHFGRIAEYADRIRQLRTVSYAESIAQNPSAPPTIIYGSYAGSSASEAGAGHATDKLNGVDNENPDRGHADA
ncbi:hypothetical protein [Tsuneonella rigui]|jgi:hypothetical protein|uniref:hypothetical protein n=1 Tax=Tsuneonella rigui TaxID=1708790 RepID=UPI000F7F1445|nr:hypothetical protein [Tsuneonella rigui]